MQISSRRLNARHVGTCNHDDGSYDIPFPNLWDGLQFLYKHSLAAEVEIKEEDAMISIVMWVILELAEKIPYINSTLLSIEELSTHIMSSNNLKAKI